MSEIVLWESSEEREDAESCRPLRGIRSISSSCVSASAAVSTSGSLVMAVGGLLGREYSSSEDSVFSKSVFSGSDVPVS